MALKEMSCGASVITWMTLLSCTGKKSLSTARYSSPVNAIVPSITSNVAR